MEYVYIWHCSLKILVHLKHKHKTIDLEFLYIKKINQKKVVDFLTNQKGISNIVNK